MKPQHANRIAIVRRGTAQLGPWGQTPLGSAVVDIDGAAHVVASLGSSSRRRFPMVSINIALLAAVGLVGLVDGGRITAAEPTTATAEASPPAAVDDQVRDQQLDIVLEAREIERVLGKIKRASELAKTRMTEAAGKAEMVSTRLLANDPQARADAAEARQMFKEISRQLEAMLTEDTPQQVAAARTMAVQLARLEREFLEQFPGALNAFTTGGIGNKDPKTIEFLDPDGKKAEQPKVPGGEGQSQANSNGNGGTTGEPNEKTAGDSAAEKDNEGEQAKPGEISPQELAEKAKELAARAKTLLDLLESVRRSDDPKDQAATKAIDEILKVSGLEQALANLEKSAEQIAAGDTESAQLAAIDAADRLELVASQLERVYRDLVSPQAEELRELEAQLASLLEESQSLDTPRDVAEWGREARNAVDEATKAGISEELTNPAQQELSQVPSGSLANASQQLGSWATTGGQYRAPTQVVNSLRSLHEEVQKQLQALALRDMASYADEALPPEYMDLVDKYYEVLSGQSNDTSIEQLKK